MNTRLVDKQAPDELDGRILFCYDKETTGSPFMEMIIWQAALMRNFPARAARNSLVIR